MRNTFFGGYLFYTKQVGCLGNELNDTTGGLDLLLGDLGDESSLDDDRDVGELTLTEDLAVTVSESVDDGGSGLRSGREVLVSVLSGNKGPQVLDVDDGLPEVVGLLVEVSHTDLTEVTGMVLIHVSSVVVLSTSHTSSTRGLSVLTDSTVTG